MKRSPSMRVLLDEQEKPVLRGGPGLSRRGVVAQHYASSRHECEEARPQRNASANSRRVCI
jgi:hypothetical protein